MNQYTLKAIFQAMMCVAKEQAPDIELPEKYEELLNEILNNNEISVTDMIDNIENVYKLIKMEESK